MLDTKAKEWGSNSDLPWQFWLPGAMLISGKMVLRLKLTSEPVCEFAPGARGGRVTIWEEGKLWLEGVALL